MNNKTINEFVFRIIWRIMEILEGVIVFLLFLPHFQLLFGLVLTLEMSEISAIFVFTTKTTQPRTQLFSVNGALTCKKAAFLMSSVD